MGRNSRIGNELYGDQNPVKNMENSRKTIRSALKTVGLLSIREGSIMGRVLTPQQEQTIRLCHHEHRGVSVESAADTMNLTVKQVKRLLSQARRKAPQMFPILTPQHRAILMMYDQHMSRKVMTAGLGITMKMLERRVAFLRQHGFLFNRTMKQYRPSMDGAVKQKF